MKAVTGQMFNQKVRLEAIKAAASVASMRENVGNLLVHAEWISTFIIEGKQPLIESENPNHCRANHVPREDQTL
jgi:hypothetical protein